MHSVCCCSLPVWRRSFLKKGTPVTYFWPALDPPLDGSGRKITTLVRDLEYFIHTKFHQNPSSGSGEEVENVNSLTDDGRTDGRQTDAGQRVITIGHWSLWLLCPKKSPTGLFQVSVTDLYLNGKYTKEKILLRSRHFCPYEKLSKVPCSVGTRTWKTSKIYEEPFYYLLSKRDITFKWIDISLKLEAISLWNVILP